MLSINNKTTNTHQKELSYSSGGDDSDYRKYVGFDGESTRIKWPREKFNKMIQLTTDVMINIMKVYIVFKDSNSRCQLSIFS